MASETAPRDSFVGQTVDERWKILDRIGSGGMGVVYRAERVKLGKVVAIKFLDERPAKSPEAVRRFEREARAISRLTHRHCVSILDFGVWRKRPYIVMEYISGVPLNKEMGKPTMTPVRGVAIMRQILEALRHAHSSGVVHRDLKPENVMLTESTATNDFVKLLDFGLARIIDIDEPTISVPRMVAGTPSYMSPEQARGEKADHRTDIYSAGVILYALCTGRKPFKADDAMDILRMHMHAPPEPPRKVAPEKRISPALEKVILRAMAKDRKDRFYHCEEFLVALKAVPEAEHGRSHRGRVWAVGALAALVAGGAGGATWLWHARRLAATTAATAATRAQQAEKAADVDVTPAAPDLASTAVTPVTPGPGTLGPATPGPATPASAGAPKAPGTTPAAAGPVVSSAAAPASAAGAAATQPAAAAAAADTPQAHVATLLEADRLSEAERFLRAQTILEPKAGWVHLQLGEIYFRRMWRRDADKEWNLALTLDRGLRHDEALQSHLCTTLGPTWAGTGERLVVHHLGRSAVPALTACIRETSDLARVQTAARLIERVAGPKRVDRALVAARTAELSTKR
jgi:eukaryotic-like serine/threonine-protein kinase